MILNVKLTNVGKANVRKTKTREETLINSYQSENFSNEGKKLQRIKSSQIVLLFDGLAFFPVRRDTPDTLTIIGIIGETTQKIYKHHQIQSLWVLGVSNGENWKTLFDI